MSDHRLPRTVLPRHYELELRPDLDAARFDGTVRIDVQVFEQVHEIVLNAADLVVADAVVKNTSGDVQVGRMVLDAELERLRLELESPLTPGEATIELTFEGELNDKLRGFYRSTFVDAAGVERTIATTQFESTNARRAFPCWDEPDAKATFGVTLVVADDLLAISSGAEVGRTDLGDGLVAVRFAPTMAMSTYLLAFVVGPLEATDAVDVDGVPLRIVHPIGKGHLTAFALEIGAFSLRHFSEYFAIAYPGDKLDLVAIPDFAFGAMENLGCATFREALLLIDPSTSTQPEQRVAADVIAHEIAHMWFGNLVTMTWWNGIWLKEAFATFCEMHTTDAWRPAWQRWVDFGLSRTSAFDTDALWSTRTIEFPVDSPDDAEAMYDVLTYEKGAAVVRMLEQYLGDDCFRDGIRHYLATHAYRNTDTPDLWDAIETVSGEPVREIMNGWIFQGGHPVVTVERTDSTTLRLRADRFTYLPADDADLVPPTRWLVPMVVATGSDEEPRTTTSILLRDDETITSGQTIGWVVANADGNGFFRTRYVGDVLGDVLRSLPNLRPIERYGLLDDTWALSMSGRQDLDELRTVVDAVAAAENEVAVWRRIGAILQGLDRHLDGAARDLHRGWARALVATAFERVGHHATNSDPARADELRGVLLATGGILGDPGLVARARALHPDPTDAERNAAAVRVIAANGDAADFDDFVDRYRQASTPQDERRYLFALPTFPGAAQMTSLLMMVADGAVRSQDAARLLGAALANPNHGEQAWRWIRDNWDLVNERYPHNSIPRMVSGVESIADPELAEEITAFFADHPVPQAGRMLDQNLERMRVTVAFSARLRSDSR